MGGNQAKERPIVIVKILLWKEHRSARSHVQSLTQVQPALRLEGVHRPLLPGRGMKETVLALGKRGAV